jgi:serine phosphatase RsbU (regulator of sigma subunit)
VLQARQSEPASARGAAALSLPGGSLGPVIDDVRGHGSDSAILISQTRALARTAARRESEPARILPDPARILSEAEAADGTSCAG